ncbi:hypothetical protein [Synechocystis sp. LKSZ1]|uniref:hypothetical protein n=1 Tax=Synechocystis sp. LKSZ1 TaxID=3144951 RepID=UPI00336C17BF
MADFFRLFTPYITYFSLIFIVIPSVIAIICRIAIYKDLQKTIAYIKQPSEDKARVIQEKFNIASQKSDKLNAGAILEEFYHEHKFKVLWFKLQCEPWNYFTQSLPNLLIAFGLLGTFLGITLNLKDISGIINQNGGEASVIVSNLQGPLQSMGIAFLSSLIAIVFSSIITIVNFIFNVDLARNELFARLENILDNDHRREENSRNRNINLFVDALKPMLKHVLHEIVFDQVSHPGRSGSAVENNQPKTLEAILVSWSRSFNHSINSFEHQMKIFEENVSSIKELFPILESSAESFKYSSTDIQRAVNGMQQHQNNLWEWRNQLADTHEEFAKTTKILGSNIKSLIENNKKATDLAESVYEQMQLSARQLQDSSLGFIEASEIIKSSDFASKLLEASFLLDNTQKQFAQSSAFLLNSTQSIAGLLQDFQSAINQVTSLGENIKLLNQRSESLLTVNQEKMAEVSKDFQSIHSSIEGVSLSLQKYQQSYLVSLQKLVNYLHLNVVQKLGENSINLQQITDAIRDYSSSLENIRQDLQASTENIVQIDNHSSQKLKALEILGQEVSALNQQSSQWLTSSQQQLSIENQELGQIKAELSKLVLTLQQYQQALNIKPEINMLTKSLVETIQQSLNTNSVSLEELAIKETGKNREEIVRLYQSINQGFGNLREINLKLNELINAINQKKI